MNYVILFIVLVLALSCGDDTQLAQQTADLNAAGAMTFWGWVHLHTFGFIVALFIVVGGTSQVIYHAGNAIARMIKGPIPELHIHVLHDGGQSITLNLSQNEIRDIIAGRSPMPLTEIEND